MTNQRWCVYALECGDGSLYVGVTDDLQSRLKSHRSGKGSKYVRSRLPFNAVRKN
jgi:putative endonuclease